MISTAVYRALKIATMLSHFLFYSPKRLLAVIVLTLLFFYVLTSSANAQSTYNYNAAIAGVPNTTKTENFVIQAWEAEPDVIVFQVWWYPTAVTCVSDGDGGCQMPNHSAYCEIVNTYESPDSWCIDDVSSSYWYDALLDPNNKFAYRNVTWESNPIPVNDIGQVDPEEPQEPDEPTEPDSGAKNITERDVKLLSLGVSGVLAFIVIRMFRWRGTHD